MNPTEAEEHLRVIRNLMERATIYRAISAPIAFIGGLLSIAACALKFWIHSHSTHIHSSSGSSYFLVIWLVVLSLTVIANTFFIWQSAKKRREPFFSAGMKMAAFCSFPAFLSAFVFTLFIFISLRGDANGLSAFLASIWIFFYGLALLSTSHFAPRSIIILGWCFLIVGLSIPFLFFCFFLAPTRLFFYDGSLLMAATFGLFHLIYAACTWPRKASQPDLTAR